MITRIAACLVFAIVLACRTPIAIAQAPADSTKLVPNPLFAAWANQKLGAAVVHIGTSKTLGLDVTIETVTTLESISAEHVTVRVKRKVTATKSEPVETDFTQTIAAKVAAENARLLAEAVEVNINGTKYSCAAYESITTVADANGESTEPANQFRIQQRQFISDQVPGGIVKIEARTDGPIAMITSIDLVEVRPAK